MMTASMIGLPEGLCPVAYRAPKVGEYFMLWGHVVKATVEQTLEQLVVTVEDGYVLIPVPGNWYRIVKK